MNNIKSGKEVAVITIHGMGREEEDYYTGFEQGLQQKLGSKWDKVAFGHIYYQDTIEPNEIAVYEKMKQAKTPFTSFFLWMLLRKFLIFFLADPTSLENGKSEKDSAYYLTQGKIAGVLQSIYDQLGQDKEKKVFIIAHSLGAQVISSYLWDASYSQYWGNDVPKNKQTHVGIWGSDKYFEENGLESDKDKLDFLLLKSIHRLYTCGCNIPLFVAGHNYITPIKRPNPNFKWLNYYNKNDVLGWPLQPLEGGKGSKDPNYPDHPTYAELVTDREISAGNLLQRWNPLSHLGYLTDKHFIGPIAEEIENLLS